MALDDRPDGTADSTAAPSAPHKDLYEVGEMPPMGHVPKQMYAWTIRRERHGEPDQSFRTEIVDVPELGTAVFLILSLRPSMRAWKRWMHRVPWSSCGCVPSWIGSLMPRRFAWTNSTTDSRTSYLV